MTPLGFASIEERLLAYCDIARCHLRHTCVLLQGDRKTADV